MQYLGGKSRIAKRLVSAMEPIRKGRQFWEPFCGGLSVSLALSETAPGIVSDGNRALVALYQAVASGWDPPTEISEDDYRAAKSLPDTDPLKAFVGFGCSFGGKWFGGYARSGGRNFAASCRSVLIRDVGQLRQKGCVLKHVDFLKIEPFSTELVLYLDPPYAGTTGYNALPFDHEVFYLRVRQWAAMTDVFVSEYSMPWGSTVLEFQHDMSVAGGVSKNARTERLYHYGPNAR